MHVAGLSVVVALLTVTGLCSSGCLALRVPLSAQTGAAAADGKQGSPQQQQNVQAQQGLTQPQPRQPFQQLQQQIQQQLAPNNGSQPQQGTGPAIPQGLPPPQPWQPFQQLQQQIQQQMNPQNGSQQKEGPTALKPTEQFVTMEQQQRPAALKQAEEERKQRQQKEQQNPENFVCGKPYMPCGSAIPEGKKCEKGAGWCESGYYCGFEATTAEPSKCLPLPKDCGKAGSPCCPSNTGRCIPLHTSFRTVYVVAG